MSTPSITPTPGNIEAARQSIAPKRMAPTVFQQIAAESQEKTPTSFFQKIKAKIRHVALPRIVNEIWVAFSPSFSTVAEAHTRFHRTAIDGSKNRDAFPILDGDLPDTVFKRFESGDFDPTMKLLRRAKISSNTMNELGKVLRRSSFLFLFQFELPLIAQKLILSHKIKRLKNGEKLIFPGGMKLHTVVYEIEKKQNTFFMKVYNSGAGTFAIPSKWKFIVPQYELASFEDAKKIASRLLEIQDETQEKIDTQYQTSGLNEAIDKVVKEHGGKIVSSSERHTLQDRGNCTSKSLSTWVRAQVTNSCVDVTDTLITAAKKMKPPLDLSPLRGQKLALSHLMKMVGYENVRNRLRKIFTSHSILFPKSHPPIEKKCSRLAFRMYHAAKEEKAANVTANAVTTYVSTLVNKIIRKPAVEFYISKKKISKPRLHHR